MAHLIDKAAVIAEIERRIDEVNQIDKASYEVGLFDAYKNVLSFLDTLEVKEVDLDADFGVYWGEYCDCDGNINDYEVAKHFYELGMMASNPTTATDRGMVEEIIINLKRVEQDYRIDLTKEIEWLDNLKYREYYDETLESTY